MLRSDRRLLLATVITLLLVPVLYAIFVLDLRIVSWDSVATHGRPPAPALAPEPAGEPA